MPPENQPLESHDEETSSDRPDEIEREKRQLKNDLRDAVRTNNTERLEEIVGVYSERYPEEAEGVALIARFNDYIEDNIRTVGARHIESDRERIAVYEHLTSYHIELTAFLAAHSHKKEYLQEFWEMLSAGATDDEDKEQIGRMRAGVLTQVAVQKIFEAYGGTPYLASAEDDALKGIDMWFDDETPVQIKGVKGQVLQYVTRTDAVSLPGTIAHDYFANSTLLRELSRFKVKLAQLPTLSGKPLTGLLIAIPFDKIDPITGMPKDEILTAIKEELAAMSPLFALQNPEDSHPDDTAHEKGGEDGDAHTLAA